ncbi:osteoclast stimulatory transmembrane protein [Erpetoichthys calabaricus]|uniref:osteoclast stimulatory transmembrane protein n=1 Tax=Erpetoichthys calabaricus TaxID=27687 RepID=UPI002234A1EF|nr:osteoclast stimulatory transmembrane protein [Erpetoichthys calabaricus]
MERMSSRPKIAQFPALSIAAKKCLPKEKQYLRYLWLVYCQSRPQSPLDLMVLLLLCITTALLTSGMLLIWMLNSLQIDHQVAGIITGVCGSLLFLLLLVIHPFRCVFTLMIPTLGTKHCYQSIKSALLMLIVLKVVSVIAANISGLLYLLKCNSLTYSESLMNSTEVLRNEIHKINNDLTKMMSTNLFKTRFSYADIVSSINLTAVGEKVHNVGEKIGQDISLAKLLFQKVSLNAKRVFSVFFAFYPFIKTSFFLKNYLHEKKHLENEGRVSRIAISLEPDKPRKAWCCKVSPQQAFNVLTTAATIALSFLPVTCVVIMDHIIYHVTAVITHVMSDFPSLPVTLTVALKEQISIPMIIHLSPTTNMKSITWNFTVTSPSCIVSPSEPDATVPVLLVLLYIIAILVTTLEVFISRLHNKIVASFFT